MSFTVSVLIETHAACTVSWRTATLNIMTVQRTV